MLEALARACASWQPLYWSPQGYCVWKEMGFGNVTAFWACDK